jgi:tripartite-type tricarboxylate transporter receptor subunit TctC
VSISERRKCRVETALIVSKSWRTQRRPVGAATLHGHPLRVKATKLPRRRFLHLAASAAAIPAVSRIASAQTYPTRPVRIIVGFPPGVASDIVARLMGQWLSERLGRPVVIENRPGANGNIGTEAVVRSAADGYTLLMVGTQNTISATLYDHLNFVFPRDVAPIASIVRGPQVLLVTPAVPTKTVPEFITYAKNNPRKLNMASTGIGTVAHVAGELFKVTAEIEMLHVPYRDLPYSDLIGGRVHVYFGSIPSAIEYIRTGRLRALAVTTATRSEMLPDIPALNEFVPGYEVSAWLGMAAPKNTAIEIIDRLNIDINAALASPVMKARLADVGGTAFATSPAEFGKFIADETEKWAKVIRAANIKAE